MKFKYSLFGMIVVSLCMLACGSATMNASNVDKRDYAPNSDGDLIYYDTHNHLFSAAGSRGGRDNFEGAARVAIETMNALGIDKIFVMPPPFAPSHPHVFTLDVLIPVQRRHPGRIVCLGGGSLNMMIHRAAPAPNIDSNLKRKFEKKALEILSKGAIGFGEFAAEHFSLNSNHPYESVAPDHPLFLLLADIAARENVPIDIHMEAIPENMPLPDRRILKRSGKNPETLQANIPGFERMLAHNRKARIIWAHAGWCNTGYRTAEFCRQMMKRHENLYMSIKLSRESVPDARPFYGKRQRVKPEWLRLFREFPDRFILGTDQFYIAPGGRPIGPQKTETTRLFMESLPPDLARKIGTENPKVIFNLNH